MGANAVTTVPVYTAGEVLTAADLNITNSGIPVFATSTTRDASFGGSGEKVLAEGQFAYLEDSNTTQYYDGAAWQSVGAQAVLQIKSTTKTDTFTTTSTTFTDVTGLSIAITPSSATNKIFVLATLATGNNSTEAMMLRLMRDSTAIAVGDAAGSRVQVTTGFYNANSDNMNTSAMSFLDSPATTSATTYKVQIRGTGAATMAVNRSANDTNAATGSRGVSTITVFEVLA
jgi:hypothetical protein